MPRKRDYNAVMKPKKHSNKLNVSLIFSSGNAKKQAKEDTLSVSSRSSNNTDTLRSTLSNLSYPESPVYSPSEFSTSSPTYPVHLQGQFSTSCPSPPTSQPGSQSSHQSYPRSTTPRSSISSVEIPFPPRPQYSDEHIYDSLEPKKKGDPVEKDLTGLTRRRQDSELSDISRQESLLSTTESELSSVFESSPSLVPPLVERESCTTPTNELSFEWHQPPTPMKLKSKEPVPSVMKPQRNLPSESNSESTFFKRASLKRRKTPKKPPNEVMTPKRNNAPSTPSTPQKSIMRNANDDIMNTPPRHSRNLSGSSRGSDSKSKTLPRRLMGTGKTSEPINELKQTESPPIPPARSSSRKASDSRSGSVSRTPSRNNSLSRTRPNSMVGSSSELTKPISRPTSMIETGNQKSSRPTSMIETGNQKSSRPTSMIENGNHKVNRPTSADNNKTSRPTSMMEIDDKTSNTMRPNSIAEIPKRTTRPNSIIEDINEVNHNTTNSVTDCSDQTLPIRPNSILESDIQIPFDQSNPVIEKNTSLIESHDKTGTNSNESNSVHNENGREGIDSSHFTSDTIKPEPVIESVHSCFDLVGAEKENDKNAVNGDMHFDKKDEVKRLNSLHDKGQENGHLLRRDSTAIYNDFEEMEALLLEQEALSEDLERERKEKSELEKARLEQEKKQEEMRGTIKNLEEEIVNVDSQVVKLKVTNGEFEDLEDHKRSLQHRLIEERGKQRQQDDLISVSGMSVYSENGLMLNQDISDYTKRELLDQVRTLRREKGELEITIKQLRCDGANEKRKQEKVIKDLTTQIRGYHMPVQRQESVGPQETMALITDLKSQLEQLKSQNNSQTKLIERLVTERNQHMVELARLKGSADEAIQLKEEVS